MPFGYFFSVTVMELEWQELNERMHDGNHGSYSTNHGLINSWVEVFMFLQEMYNWQVQHNVLHHTTNIPVMTKIRCW
jgi:fatty acid desaturase